MAAKIMITDDHSMIREGLKSLLELDGDIEVIAEAENGEECLQKLLSVKPDVLLLDINMPKMNGLEVLKTLKDAKSKVKVLVLTVHNETEYLKKIKNKYNLNYIYLKEDKEFNLINSKATSECVLMFSIEVLPIILKESKILILGYGNSAKD